MTFVRSIHKLMQASGTSFSVLCSHTYNSVSVVNYHDFGMDIDLHRVEESNEKQNAREKFRTETEERRCCQGRGHTYLFGAQLRLRVSDLLAHNINLNRQERNRS